jgi:hypothetical protein
LVVILRHLELVAISMAHGIIDECIVYDGMCYIFAKTYGAALPYIEQERARRGDPAIYENFERYAVKWKIRAPEHKRAFA